MCTDAKGVLKFIFSYKCSIELPVITRIIKAEDSCQAKHVSNCSYKTAESLHRFVDNGDT